MKNLITKTALTSALLAGLASCTNPPQVAKQSPEAAAQILPEQPQVQAKIVAGGNAFSAELYSELAQKPGNVFVSPISVSLAFGLLYPGASGETASEISDTLGYTDDRTITANGLGYLMTALETDNEREKLRIANAVWTAHNAAPAPDYQSLVRNQMQAEMKSLDFSHSVKSAKTINDWVAARTNGRILDLVPSSALTANTRSVLTNAIWFKADWADPFTKESTDPDGTFTRRVGNTETAAMMRQITDARYLEKPHAQFTELDYAGDNFSLVVALPKQTSGIDALEADIAKGKLGGWLDELSNAELARLNLTMPKVKLKTSARLNQPLQAIGIRKAFTPGAELSGLLASEEPLMIDAVLHKTFLEIDEKGTEAAAATAIVNVTTSARVEFEEPIEFKIDRPYFIAMRHKPTGALLFMGRIETVSED